MRIKRNDIVTPTYTATDSVDAEGIVTKAWVRGSDISADWQPVGKESILREFGLDIQGTDAWTVYCDKGALPLGIVAEKGGKSYQCQAIKAWYDHDESIMVPYAR